MPYETDYPKACQSQLRTEAKRRDKPTHGPEHRGEWHDGDSVVPALVLPWFNLGFESVCLEGVAAKRRWNRKTFKADKQR